jgi:hypothetical protein
MSSNLKKIISDARATLADAGSQSISLLQDIEKAFSTKINAQKKYHYSRNAAYANDTNRSDRVFTSFLINIPLELESKTEVTHHFACQVTLYDESEMNIENWAPCIYVSFGPGNEKEPFKISPGQLFFFEDIETREEYKLNIDKNQKLLRWSENKPNDYFQFVVPLEYLEPDNFESQIIDPAISLIKNENARNPFSEDSIAFNFEIADNKLSIKK